MQQVRSRFQAAIAFSALTTLVPTLALATLSPATTQAPTAATLAGQTTGQLLAKRPKNASNSYNGGGVRGECPVGNKTLKVLLPEKDPGQTTQDYPTFWFYLPFGRTAFTKADGISEGSVTSAKFVLLDENRKPALKKPIVLPLPDQAGIVRFTLPASEKPLEVGKDYNWFFSITCDTQQVSANPIVSGWITRVAAKPALTSQLKQTSPQNQYLAYRENGLWLESISQLANNRTQQAAAWTELLKLFDLQEFAQAPIVELQPAPKP